MKKFDVRRIAIDAAFSAISVVLYCFLKFKLPTIFPSFLEFNFSMLPILIILFTFGPADGICASFIRTNGKLIFVGTSTSYVGELADLLIAILVCLIVYLGYIFASKRTESEAKRGIIAALFGIFAWTFSAIILNWIVLVPAYIELFFHGNKAPLVGMCDMIPGINSNNFMPMYLLFAVLPFNLLLSSVVSIVTYLVHLRTYKLFSSGNVTKDDFKKIEEKLENAE